VPQSHVAKGTGLQRWAKRRQTSIRVPLWIRPGVRMKQRYFDLAKKVSQLSTHPQFKIGCVIVKGNNIVSLSHNKLKTSPRAATPYNQLHAEIGAILSAEKKDLKGSKSYTYRAHKDGSLALSKPCIHCQAALAEVGITTAYFTTDTGHEEVQLID
jgi:deoxycytidylate deaminase